MVDNLRYGGSTADGGVVNDYCAGRTTFNGIGSVSPNSAWFVAINGLSTTTALYGDCRDPAAGAPYANGSDATNSCLSNTSCGYYYNWQAAMQEPTAYYDSAYTDSTPGDICPLGWHVPAGESGEFVVLDIANGGTGTTQSSCNTDSCDFWLPGGNWNGLYSGFSDNVGNATNQGSRSYFWSSSSYNAAAAYSSRFYASYVNPDEHANRHYGYTVRCIQNLPIPAPPATITPSSPIYAGQTQTISWDTSDYATSYVLEGKCGSSGDYIQLDHCSGSSTTCSNPITGCTTTVQYRVKACNGDNVCSGWRESSVINVSSCGDGCNKCTNATTCASDGCASGFNFSAGQCEMIPICSLGATGTMQTWTGCASLPTPTLTVGVKSTYFTQGPCLTDERDGKNYEIRKFPDGKCWMVDNLAYGGTTTQSGSTDYCATSTSIPAPDTINPVCTTNAAWYGKIGAQAIGAGTAAQIYGDCANPRLNADIAGPCYNSNQCGYYYNWQAATQLPTACSILTAATYPNGTPSNTNYLQGICPSGWHLPSGGANQSAEFDTLYVLTGGTGSASPGTTFWQPSVSSAITSADPWKGLYSGSISYATGISAQGSKGSWWSSNQLSSPGAFALSIDTLVLPMEMGSKPNGLTVRCIKD
jgi:uncharacterized protein (TIGR02145 family)